jgi:D-alanyl-D-alanine carboxypeptidase/D-alanyl-D-alanine-endopeptidase (penicillin-binding protein 4)
VAGQDGTLRERMLSPALVGRVQAKTGTVSTVRTLSGYLTAPNGERYAFSMMANGALSPAAEIDRVAETALYRLTLE